MVGYPGGEPGHEVGQRYGVVEPGVRGWPRDEARSIEEDAHRLHFRLEPNPATSRGGIARSKDEPDGGLRVDGS